MLGVLSGLVSLLVSGVIVFLKHHHKDTTKGNPLLAVFFLVWWTLSAGILTDVGGVFSQTNNGYFATWFTFFSSLYFSFLVLPTMSGIMSNITGANGLAVLCIASCVEFAVAWDLCSKTRCSGSSAWAICCGLMSFCITMGHLVYAHCKPQTAANHAKAMAMFLFCWWTLGVIFITSSTGPFADTGISANGFFSTWLAFFSSCYFCMMNVERMRSLYVASGGILGVPNFASSNDYLHAHDNEIDPETGFVHNEFGESEFPVAAEEPHEDEDGYTHFDPRSRSVSKVAHTDTNGDGEVLLQNDDVENDPDYTDL